MICIKCSAQVPEGSLYYNLCGAKQEKPSRSTKKRGNGQGTVYRRESGKWQAGTTLGFYVRDGKRYRKKVTKGGFEKKKDALAYLAALQNGMEKKKRITVSELWELFQASKMKTLGHSKQVAYRAAYNKIKDKELPMEIKKCNITDISDIGAFYDRIVLHMDETGTNYPKWMYQIYPSEQSVKASVQEGSQYFCTLDGQICAAFVLNENPGGAYEKGDWKQSLQIGEYLVIHTLAVAPELSHQGVATKIIRYCMDHARSNGYKALRIDVVSTNFPAIQLYKKLGFTDAGEKDLERNIPGIPTFTLLEYLISDE